MAEFFLGCVVGATIEAFVALLAVWLHSNWE